MTDKVFVDSNIWLYAFIKSKGHEEKRVKAKSCIVEADDIVISTQVVNEVCINLMRKGKKDDAFIDRFIRDFVSTYGVMSQTKDDVLEASRIRKDYCFSYWDSLIVACALRGQCKMVCRFMSRCKL